MNKKTLAVIGLLLVPPVLAYALGPEPYQAVDRGRYLVNAFGCVDCHSPWTMGASGPMPDPARFLSGHPEALVMPPILAITTRGKYYLRRTHDGIDLPMYDEHGNPSDAHLKCEVCHHDYERPDMLKSAKGDGYICSLCLSTDKKGEHVLPAQT